MKNRHQDGQASLFNDDEMKNQQLHPLNNSSPPPRPPFDSALLQRIDHNGEPHVTATSACEAMHYGSPRHFREFIKRLNTTEQWGSLSYRATMITVGKGARISIEEPLLTEKQLVIVCMRSDQPNMAEVRSLIAEVFIAWRHGRLRAADAHTEVRLQEATDQAIDAMPSFFAWCQEIMDTGKAARDAKRAAEQAAQSVAEIANNQRRYPEARTVRDARWVNKNNYRDRCPCCQRVVIGSAGGVWAHMKGKYRRTVRDGWFVCEKCNLDYENSKNTIEIYIAFIGYLSHVEAYLAQGRFF